MAPHGRAAQLIVDQLHKGGFAAFACPSVVDLISSMRENAGVAILAEEALTDENVLPLSECLEQQSTWSDFPLILLTREGDVTCISRNHRLLRGPLENALLLERPVRPETLLSMIANALRGRKRQYQIRDQMEQFGLAADALRKAEKLAVAGRLAASIAHEINNPLEAVTNLLYLLRSTPQSEEGKNYLQLAEQELSRVSAIAMQTLKFYRETAKPASVDVPELLESVLALYGPRLSASDIRVILEFDTSRTVMAKAGELRQLFANLVGNAIDAMRNGGTLRLRVRHLEREPFRQYVRVSVADTGTGIPDELRGKVFEPFISTKGDTGTGLGLWVSKEIIENHGGTIRVKSSTAAQGHGTTFSVYLPAAKAA